MTKNVARVVVALVGLVGTIGCSASSTAAPHATQQSLPTAPATAAREAGKAFVKVPAKAAHTDVIDAYDLLRRRGLRVTLAKPFDITSLDIPGVKMVPDAGSRVAAGSTVVISPGFAALGSPGVLTSHPHYVVPSFTGQPLNDAIGWADQHNMFWSVPTLAAIQSSDAPHLFDAYRVVGQQPSAGATITQGISNGNSFRPTPLTLSVVPIA